MKIRRHSEIIKHLPALIIIAMSFLITAGCNPPQPVPIDNGPEPEPPAFVWNTDTSRMVPRWRSNSPIQWHATLDTDTVISESRTSGKPILCYISRYDSDLTGTVEDGLLTANTWGQTIADNFVTWEVDWWRNPEFAQSLLGSMNAPALFVLIVSPDASSNELGIVDHWAGTELLKFPLHAGLLPLGTLEAESRIAEFAQTGWDALEEQELQRMDIDPEEFSTEYFNSLGSGLRNDVEYFPQDCLAAAYMFADKDEVLTEIGNRVNAWEAYMNEMSGMTAPWIPDEAFAIGSGWSVDPVKTIDAVLCAEVTGSEWPVPPGYLLGWLKTAINQDTEEGGGFPPYFDLRNTFDANLPYQDDESEISPDTIIQFRTSPRMGPRDIVWVNARMLARIFRLLNAYPEIPEVPTGPDDELKAGEFFDSTTKLMLESMLEKAGEVGEMSLPDKIYILDLLNQLYQRTADISYLQKAGDIAATFPPDSPDSWFDPWQLPFMPDLAIALHQYGWLAENEPARSAADYITEEGIAYAAGFGTVVESQMAVAYDIVHSKCLHVGVLSTPDDELGRTFLAYSLQGWDPRKIAQILDPQRDSALMELKGYVDMDRTAAMICVDDMCYMPAFDQDALAETLTEARDGFYEVIEE